MKAITILQPWASLIACGAKKIETRSWATKYRGKIAIHAAKNINTPKCAWQEPFMSELSKAGMISEKGGFLLKHNGMVIAIADLVDCLKINESQMYYLKLHQEQGINNEYAFGDYSIGRYAWILENVRQIDPVPAKGMQRIWEWEP